MFETAAQSELRHPVELLHASLSRWRMVESIGPGFFVAVLRFKSDEPGTRRTTMLCWDSDLVHLVENPKLRARLFSVHHFSSGGAWNIGRPPIQEIRQIWRGLDRSARDAEVIIFKTADSSEFCGLETIPVPTSVERVALIAGIGSESDNDGTS